MWTYGAVLREFFVIQEIIVGSIVGVLWISLNSAIKNANSNSFSNVIPLLYLIFVVILLIPVILHLHDIHNLIK